MLAYHPILAQAVDAAETAEGVASTGTIQQRLISLLGLFVMIGLAWLMSSHKRKIPWRIVFGGLGLQLAFALLILRTDTGQALFKWLGNFFSAVVNTTDVGSAFLFNIYPQPGDAALPPTYTLWRSFAFGVLPTIVFFSSLMAILYHLGVMQRVVQAFAWVMQKTLGTSGAETLSAAANIFVGQTEAPLVVRPYVGQMTMSELNVVMVGGFATIAGGVLAIFLRIGIDPGHLITASVISAPAALLIAKVMQPETEEPKTAGSLKLDAKSTSVNVVEAAAEGASTGMQLALNVAAMLIAFVALVALADLGLGWLGVQFGFKEEAAWTLNKVFAFFFAPFAWLMSIPWEECGAAGSLLGTKMVVNEVVAYIDLAAVSEKGQLSGRSVDIMTYALCGFANFSSIGIQLGGIGGIAPERRGDLAKLGFRAMLGGTLAAFMTACVAGILL
ncbi:NupC/NupG family nucleoside CNT transporter [Adhaeretor mobilis]|uniref:Nucleoside permease n=1 Tax=Adhaeretor mobilis TaxID=1930276 RepID=A0A517MUW4_9BACT|nr:NupC/NupG family nucleoside CNT transporter [Adhaeretor mobilis]QDS98674.1 Nucleoside permease NupX [Adhaeretor mobilis]